MTGGELTGTQIRALLHELGRRLQAAGAHGDVKLVGGAALILQGIGNRPTADIDASYSDSHTIHTVVADMAADYDLAPDWLNTNASAFVPDNATWVDLEHLDGLTIQAADTETLLAMKIAAERDKGHRPTPAPTQHHQRRRRRRPRLQQIRRTLHPLAAGRDNYLIVVDDALDAATTLQSETDD